ncbi:MAG TPA: NUMOD3 domain-containing DNA-binding protein [Caldisericia bacterium]|nr:NUMOD3 domain-containing DNA-binding protein [Caldisericia bacterium]
MSLQDFLVYDENIDQKVQKQEPLLLEDRRFYVYALLDSRKIGARIYRDLKYVFTLEPFYIGYGHNLRFYDHFKEADNLWEKSEKIQKCGNPMKIRKIHQIYRDYDLPRVVIIKEGLTLKEALEYEIFCITQIGRKDKKEGPLTNLTDGGGGCDGYIHTEEQNRKNSERNKGKFFIYNKELNIEKRINKDDPIPDGWIKGRKPFNNIHCEKMSKSRKGKTYEELYGEEKAKELKIEFSKNMKGKNNPNFGAKCQTPEIRTKISKRIKENYIKNPQLRINVGIFHKNRIRSEEENNKCKRFGKDNNFYGKKHSENTINYLSKKKTKFIYYIQINSIWYSFDKNSDFIKFCKNNNLNGGSILCYLREENKIINYKKIKAYKKRK